MNPSRAPGAGPTVRRSPSEHDRTETTYILSVVEGPDAGTSFTLDISSPTRVLLGTSPVCTARLTDPQVSRRHAALAVTPASVQLLDLGSTNGTTINGVIVKEASLVGGEAVRIGATVLTLHRGETKVSDLGSTTSFGRILGGSAAMRRLYRSFEALSAGDGPVLIEGEVGTGKELLAEELHRASPRSEGPFIVLEASATSSDQIAAILFGATGEPGSLESARGGVVFIDEVGDLPRHVQKKLRGLVESSTDVRLIGATRRDLDRDVTEGLFDEAFFFALANGRVELPPLRDRSGDVAVLARHFWEELVRDAPAPFPTDFLPRFEHYPWPGNVRELRTAVKQRATLGPLAKTYLSDRAGAEGLDIIAAVIQDEVPFTTARDRVMYDFQRRYIEAVLARHGGNVGAAARASGIARRYFQVVRARSR